MEVSVDKILNIINTHLWELLVHNTNLIEHLNSIRDYLLLGNGELFQLFIELSRPLMIQPIRVTSEQDIIFGPWLHASHVLDLDINDKYFHNFNLKIQTLSFNFNDNNNFNEICFAGIINQSDESSIFIIY